MTLLGIGNPLRKDDGLGSYLVGLLKEKASRSVKVLDCGSVPENFTYVVRKFNPTHILMIDAAELSVKPGEVRFVPIERIRGLAISTHTLPLHVLAKYLRQTVRTRIALLAVQPKEIAFEMGLTPEIARATKDIASEIRGVLAKTMKID